MILLNNFEKTFSKRLKPSQLSPSNHPSTEIYEDAEHFHNILWSSLTGDELERYSDAFSGFSPLAFCYFLPGAICASVRENRPELIIIHQLIGMLDRSPEISLWDTFFLERWTLLSKAECDVVQEWILWLADIEDSPFSQDSLMRAYETLSLLASENEAFSRFRNRIFNV